MSQECLLAAVEQAVVLVDERARLAYGPEDAWVDRVRAGLFALLELFDERPAFARQCVVHALAGGPEVLARRGEVLARVARVIDEGREDARREPPPLTAEGVVSGALGVIHTRLLDADAGRLTELLNPLMSFIVTPYLGGGAARIELHRPAPAPTAATGRNDAVLSVAPAVAPLEGVETRLTPRTVRVLEAIAARPGLSNSEVSMHAGVTDQGQISKLLARLARVGLIESRPRKVKHAWRLTHKGHELQRTLRGASAAGAQ
jgi:AcrR family transcriptional regulator